MKRGLGAGMAVCGRCKRSVASSFADCPFCGAKMAPASADTRAPAPAAAAIPARVSVHEAAPTAAAIPDLDLDPGPAATRAQPPTPELELAHPGAPSPGPELDLEIESSRLPRSEPPARAELEKPPGIPTLPELELDLPKQPARIPTPAPPTSAPPTPAPPPPAPAAAWGAIEASVAPSVGPSVEPAAPAPAPVTEAPRVEAPAPAPQSFVPRASFAGPRGGLARGAKQPKGGKHPLLWAGLGLTLLALLPLGCGMLATGSSREVEVRSLIGLGNTRSLRIIEGFAARSDGVELDPSRPIPLRSPYELASKRELVGRTVELVATPISLAIQKRYRIGPDGRRQEVDALTNIYAPVTLDQRIWVVSAPVEAQSPSDPAVVQFGAQGSYRGVVKHLSSVVDLNLLRHAEHEGPAVVSAAPTGAIPDDALAIVVYATSSGDRVLAAPIMGTERRVWAMTGAESLPDTELFGDYVTCPAKSCELIESVAVSPPAGVLHVRQNVVGALGSTVRKAGVLLLLLGIALGGTGWILGRARAA